MSLKKISTILVSGALAAVMLAGCGLNGSATAITVNGEDLSLGAVNFAARQTQAEYDSMFMSMYGEDYWTSDALKNEDGTTLEDTTIDLVVEALEDNMLLDQNKADYSVEITDEENAAIEKAAADFISANDKKTLKLMTADEESVKKVLYLDTVQAKMMSAIKATADQNVSDEDAKQRTFSYVRITLNGKYDETGTLVEYTEDEIAALKADAEELAAAGENFDTLAEEKEFTVNTYSYGKDEPELQEEGTGFQESSVIDAADKLKEGEISEVIETETALYIVRLDSEDDKEAMETKKQRIITERETAKYEEVLQAYRDAAEITVNEEEIEKIHFDTLFTILETETESDDAGELSVY